MTDHDLAVFTGGYCPLFQRIHARDGKFFKIQERILAEGIDQFAEQALKVLLPIAGLYHIVQSHPHLPGNVVKTQVRVDQGEPRFFVQLIEDLVGVLRSILFIGIGSDLVSGVNTEEAVNMGHIPLSQPAGTAFPGIGEEKDIVFHIFFSVCRSSVSVCGSGGRTGLRAFVLHKAEIAVIGPVVPRDDGFIDRVVLHAGKKRQDTVEKAQTIFCRLLIFRILDHHFLSLRFGEIMADMNVGLAGRKESILQEPDYTRDRQQAFSGGIKGHAGALGIRRRAVVDREHILVPCAGIGICCSAGASRSIPVAAKAGQNVCDRAGRMHDSRA